MRIGHPIEREIGLADRVVHHMTDQIVNGILPADSRLPSERVLAEQYGVSRTVIREAVRTLVSKGLLGSRAGGGIHVNGPGPSTAAESITLLLRLHHGGAPVPYWKVHELRRVLEPEIASLAATRAQRADIAVLERQLERQRQADNDIQEYIASDVAFHAGLATATHNELFPVLLNSISGVMVEVRELGFSVHGSHENALKHHERVLRAVASGDASEAARSMLDHLRDSENILQEGLKIKAERGDAKP